MKIRVAIALVTVFCAGCLFLAGCGGAASAADGGGGSGAESGVGPLVSQQTASGDYIGEDAAKAAALAHAGLTEADVTFVRVHLDRDDGRWEYEVEFYSGNVEYDYDIDALTGDILAFDQDAEYVTAPSAAQAASGDYIGEDAAKAAALAHAGLTEADVTFVRVHLDRDDGRWEYEVEFFSGNVEYDYDIDALTGAILSFDQDAEYIVAPDARETGGNHIGEEEAKRIALADAGFSESEVVALRVGFDYDDGRAEYDVEWYVGYTEYSYEIDATSGAILGHEIDTDD